MNDPKFVKSELKVTASEELEEEVKAELEEDHEQKSIASIIANQEEEEDGKISED